MLAVFVFFNFIFTKLYNFLFIFLYNKQKTVFYDLPLLLFKSASHNKFTVSLLLIPLILQR